MYTRAWRIVQENKKIFRLGQYKFFLNVILLSKVFMYLRKELDCVHCSALIASSSNKCVCRNVNIYEYFRRW